MNHTQITREWISALEDREQRRTGVRLPQARRALGRRIGVAPGTLENVKRGRTKGVRAWVYERIREAFIDDVQKEMGFLTHELDIARQANLGAPQNQISEIETHLSQLREMLN